MSVTMHEQDHSSFSGAANDNKNVEKLLAVVDEVLSTLQRVVQENCPSSGESLVRLSGLENTQETNETLERQKRDPVGWTQSKPFPSVERLQVTPEDTYQLPKSITSLGGTYHTQTLDLNDPFGCLLNERLRCKNVSRSNFTSNLVDPSDPILPPSELRGRRVPFGDLNAPRCMTVDRSITTFNIDGASVIDCESIVTPDSTNHTSSNRGSPASQLRGFERLHLLCPHHLDLSGICVPKPSIVLVNEPAESGVPSPVPVLPRNDAPAAPFEPATFASHFPMQTCHCQWCQWHTPDSMFPKYTSNFVLPVMESIRVPQRIVAVNATEQKALLDLLIYGGEAEDSILECFCGDPKCDAGF